MVTARIKTEQFPHVSFREVVGGTEAYLPGTGLAVWEIAWLEHVYSGDLDAVACHLSIEADLVAEALYYVREHQAEIEPAVQIMEDASEERLREILPGMRVIHVDLGSSGGHAS